MNETIPDKATIFSWLEEIKDPEVPVLSIIDLGIVRDIHLQDANLEIVITPTYSGCPAMDMIASLIKMEMAAHGYPGARITTILSPAWTTD